MSSIIYYIRNTILKSEKEAGIFFIIFYSVGVSGIVIPATRDLFITLTPLALLLGLTAILVFHQPRDLKREIIVFPSIYLISFFIEAGGVSTGRIFGNYSYGTGLGIKVLDTPLLIGINWVLLVYCTAVIAGRMAVPEILKVIISSLMMVFYDAILEQVAPKMDMWSFEEGNVPLRNYFAWLVLALIFHTLLKLTGIKIMNRPAAFIFYIQSIFFIILTIFFKLTE